MIEKNMTIEEKWKLDIDAYNNGARVKIKFPQCEECKHFIKGDALHCNKYINERKPREVLLVQRECSLFVTKNKLGVYLCGEPEKRLFGGVFGFIVGDILGVPVEFSSRQERDIDPVREMRAYGTYHQPFGSWSDDTSFTLCLMDAMLKEDIIYNLKKNMVDCYKKGMFTPRGQLFDIGISTSEAINKMIQDVNPLECGGIEESDNGNGSLMRVLPLTFIRDMYQEQEFVRLIEDVSSVTHRHNRAKLACIIYVLFASNLYEGKKKREALDNAVQVVLNKYGVKYKSEISNYSLIFDKLIIDADKRQIRSTGYVVDTLEAAIWSFFEGNNYKEVVLNAINLGGDTDTIAAIAGGLAGIYYGFDEIPDIWIQNICNKEKIKTLCDKFNENRSLKMAKKIQQDMDSLLD